MNELLRAVPFYLIFTLFGIIGYAFAIRFSKSRSLLTYIIAKPLGLIIFAYPIWLLSSLKLLKFNNQALLVTLFILSIFGAIFSIYSFFKKQKKKSKNENIVFWKDSFFVKLIVIELVSLVLFFGYLYIRGFSASLESTEKFMDLHLLMSSGKTDFFPFFDGWWSIKTVNYYYYGFYIFALLVRLSGIPFAYGYNFSLGIIFVSTLLISFAIVYKLTKSRVFSIFGAGLVGLAGNLHYATCFFQNQGTDLTTKCYYPKATRIIDPSYTINEFPSYSFILGDMHPHVISIPFFLTNIYLLILIHKSKKLNHYLMFAYMITLASTALINFWDFVTLGLLFALIFCRKVYLKFKSLKKAKSTTLGFIKEFAFQHRYFLLWSISFAIAPFILFRPYFASFTSPVTGIGFAPTFVAAHPEVQSFQYPSSFWFLFGIWGMYLIIGILGLAVVLLLRKVSVKKIFIPLCLIGTGVFLILFTETFFFRDLFHVANPPYFRANTVFKFGYHAWILLSLTAATMLYFIWKSLSSVKKLILGLVADILFLGLCIAFAFTVFLYPFVGISQAYGPAMPWNLSKEPFFTLDGSKYIQSRNIGDYETIQWINEHENERVVLLEAVGGSYTYFGRIGVNTGMGNPLNWESHEWTWRFHYPSNIKSWKDTLGKSIDTGYGEVAEAAADVKNMYESSDIEQTRTLLQKYRVKYVYIGDQERITYSGLDESKFDKIGRIVFYSGESKLYLIN